MSLVDPEKSGVSGLMVATEPEETVPPRDTAWSESLEIGEMMTVFTMGAG